MQKKTKNNRASRQNIGYAYIAIWIIGFLVLNFIRLCPLFSIALRTIICSRNL